MAHIDDPETRRANMLFIKTSMQAPLLSRDHELDLATRWRDKADQHALHELTQSYMRLAVSIATRFRNYGLPIGDLVQEGTVGLMQAAARFEPERGVRFSTYAAWWIRSAMQDYVLRNWSIVRTGTTAAQKSLFFNLRRLRARIEAMNGQEQVQMSAEGRAQIAETLNVSKRDVEAMEQRLIASDQSLNNPIGESGEEEWLDQLADDRPNPEDVVIGMRNSETRSRWLAEALGQLTDRERQIIRERRLTDEGATLEQLGSILGVSKERVRQLESRALSKLRSYMEQHVDNGRDLFLEE